MPYAAAPALPGCGEEQHTLRVCWRYVESRLPLLSWGKTSADAAVTNHMCITVRDTAAQHLSSWNQPSWPSSCRAWYTASCNMQQLPLRAM
jgi:hypothetical protein